MVWMGLRYNRGAFLWQTGISQISLENFHEEVKGENISYCCKEDLRELEDWLNIGDKERSWSKEILLTTLKVTTDFDPNWMKLPIWSHTCSCQSMTFRLNSNFIKIFGQTKLKLWIFKPCEWSCFQYYQNKAIFKIHSISFLSSSLYYMNILIIIRSSGGLQAKHKWHLGFQLGNPSALFWLVHY